MNSGNNAALVTVEDLELACEAIFDGNRRPDALRVPIEQRVACAIAAVRFSCGRNVVVLPRRDRSAK